MTVRYLIRAVKYLIYFTVLTVALLALVYFTSHSAQNFKFTDLIDPSKQLAFVIFMVAVAAIYPMVGFQKISMPCTKNLASLKEPLTDVFQNGAFVLEQQTTEALVFRPRSKFTRLVRVYEDQITVTSDGENLYFEGMRRDLLRFQRALEFRLSNEQNEEQHTV